MQKSAVKSYVQKHNFGFSINRESPLEGATRQARMVRAVPMKIGLNTRADR